MLWFGAAVPAVAGVVVVVPLDPLFGFAPVPPVLEVGVVVVAAPPDPALAAPADDPALLVGVLPDAGAVIAGLDVLFSEAQPTVAAPATMTTDAQSRCEFVIILLRAPRCLALGL
jgi:hypothetical protein